MAEQQLSFSQNDYEIVKREVLCEGFFRFTRYFVRIRKYEGGWSNVFDREVLEHKSAVSVLPYDPILDQVILIEQFRVGAIANPQSPWLMETVAGLYDQGEKPIEVARKEAKEEADCEILDIYPICGYFVSPGSSTEHIQLFCGRVDASNAGGIHGLLDENEDIKVNVLSAETAFKWLQEGKIKTSPAIISLQWLQLNREWLRQLWQKK